MVICCIGFQLDTGLFAFVAASVLILLSVANVAVNVLLSALGVFNLFGLFY